MTNEETRKLAEEHWKYTEQIFKLCGETESNLKKLHYVYVESGVHMAKHERESNKLKEK
ncbi:hypothetical protein M0R04_08465 [Candidatus Dojkabacteria bacterium]|jgi:hypothetical protein|nr:hypothetical protein [Candidatus Dojkabacteria bacterium]